MFSQVSFTNLLTSTLEAMESYLKWMEFSIVSLSWLEWVIGWKSYGLEGIKCVESKQLKILWLAKVIEFYLNGDCLIAL